MDALIADSAFFRNAIIAADALLNPPDVLTISQAPRVAALLAPHRVPALHTVRAYPEAGGLAAYGPSLPDQVRAIAPTVAKVLAGPKPGEIPIEQPTRFERVLNVKTARGVGLALPVLLLAAADEVIE